MDMQQLRAGIDGLRERADALRAEVDAAVRSPFEQRAAEERARIAHAKYVSCWNAQQAIEDNDRQRADPMAVATALREIRSERGPARAELADRISRMHDASRIRVALLQLAEMDAELHVIDHGAEQLSPSFTNMPDTLVRDLAARGIVPLPGCAHVLERRGGLRQLEARLSELRQQRARAVGVLMREHDLQPAALAG
jgi:hypothetical protein